ncbi:hypothetical protein LTR08_005089 [Meristemomyces frigidus]|nr:hypothetical protein LTR08_005089 [Meristemomyces frigidus]
MDEPQPFRLFDLPPELRLRIYSYALAPTGVLSITTTKTKRYAVTPDITPLLLATCKQIHHEAHDILYAENEVCFAIDAHDTCWPTVSERRFPQRVLQRLQHVCLILDMTAPFRADYADVDFAALEALIELRTLRMAMVCQKVYAELLLALDPPLEPGGNSVFPQILERIPAAARVYYGTVDGSQQMAMVQAILNMRSIGNGGIVVNGRGNGKVVIEASGELLDGAVGRLEGVVQGCKSGATVDAFAEARAMH